MDPLEELIFNEIAQNYLGANTPSMPSMPQATSTSPFQLQHHSGSQQQQQPQAQPQFAPFNFAPPRPGMVALPDRPGDMSHRYADQQGNESLYAKPLTADQRNPGGLGNLQLPQVQNLQQLQEVITQLKGVPPDLLAEILAKVTGRPYMDPKQQTLQNALLQAKATHELNAPQRAEAAEGRQESRDIRREGQETSRQMQEAQLALRVEQLIQREEGIVGKQLDEIKKLQDIAERTLDPINREALMKLVEQAKTKLPGVAQFLGPQAQLGGGNVAARPPAAPRRTVLPNGIVVTSEMPVSMNNKVSMESPTSIPRPPDRTFGADLANFMKPVSGGGGGEATRNYQWQQEKKQLTIGAQTAILTRARQLASKAGMNPMAPEMFLLPFIKIAQQEVLRKQGSN